MNRRWITVIVLIFGLSLAGGLFLWFFVLTPEFSITGLVYYLSVRYNRLDQIRFLIQNTGNKDANNIRIEVTFTFPITEQLERIAEESIDTEVFVLAPEKEVISLSGGLNKMIKNGSFTLHQLRINPLKGVMEHHYVNNIVRIELVEGQTVYYVGNEINANYTITLNSIKSFIEVETLYFPEGNMTQIVKGGNSVVSLKPMEVREVTINLTSFMNEFWLAYWEQYYPRKYVYPFSIGIGAIQDHRWGGRVVDSKLDVIDSNWADMKIPYKIDIACEEGKRKSLNGTLSSYDFEIGQSSRPRDDHSISERKVIIIDLQILGG